MSANETKNVILTRKLNNVLYDLMVKTTSDMVYVDEYTLTERLIDIANVLTSTSKKISEVSENLEKLMEGSPGTFQTFKEVWDYVNVNGDPKSELIKMIRGKQDSEEGKGLSTHDLSDLLYEKLVNNYTREELDEKFEILIDESSVAKLSERVSELENTPNIICSDSPTTPDSVKNYNCWYQVIRSDR